MDDQRVLQLCLNGKNTKKITFRKAMALKVKENHETT